MSKKELAESEFYQFCEYNDLCTDEEELGEEQIEALTSAKQAMVYAFEKGNLSFSNGKLNLRLSHAIGVMSELEIGEITGADLVSMEKVKAEGNWGNTIKLICSFCQIPQAQCEQIKLKDIRLLQKIINLFFI